MSSYRELLYHKLLLERLDRLEPDERDLLARMLIHNNDHKEVMDALGLQKEQLSRIAQKVENQSFAASFGSDLLANFTSAGLFLLGSALLKKL